MPKTVTVVIRRGEKWYVAECVEVDVITQGRTVEEALENMAEALELYFEGEEVEEVPSEPPIITVLSVGGHEKAGT